MQVSDMTRSDKTVGERRVYDVDDGAGIDKGKMKGMRQL